MLKKLISRLLVLTLLTGTFVYTLPACSDPSDDDDDDDPNADFKPKAQIVNKDNTDAVVTYILDDGNKPTATFIKEQFLSNKLSACSFGVVTEAFASLTENATHTEYVKENGKYVLTQNAQQQENVAFWGDILNSGNCELLSHTHTHNYWGTNDDGGTFKYVENNSDTIKTATFPKGSSSKEIYASKQIIEEYFPSSLYPNQNPITYVRAGIGIRNEAYTPTGSSESIPSYLTYFNSVMKSAINTGAYIGARTTFQVNNTASSNYVITTNNFKTVEGRYMLPAYMILNSNKGSTGIENWTAYIDHAIQKNGMAAFCIHNIMKPSNANGHYILEDDAAALFAYAESKNVWVATFTDAMIYYSEWSSATIRTSYKDGAVRVTVTDDENDTIFNMPLTVKVTLPDSWELAAVGDTVYTPEYDDDGNSYILLNIVPDSGRVDITDATPNA